MSRRVSRLHALLASAVLLFANGRGMLGPLDCPQHGVQTGGRADGQMGGGHAAHMSHGSRLPAPDARPTSHDSKHHSGCTCLEHCSACQIAGLPSIALRLPETRFITGTGYVTPAVPARVPARPDHQLPFAQAPPQTV